MQSSNDNKNSPTEQQSTSERKPMMCGAPANERPADEEVQGMVDKLYDSLSSQLGKSPKKFEAHSYRSQVVNGINYFVKVKTDDADGGKFAHLRIHKPFDGDAQLVRVQADKAVGDKIESF